jgi:ribosomal protein S18 acetylase RimI-like enzyme
MLLNAPERSSATSSMGRSAILFTRCIYVEPSMLGQGIGWALWQQVARHARDGEKSAIELWVLEGNRLGIDWYDRQGGHVVGRREIELADGAHAELRYRFDLSTS